MKTTTIFSKTLKAYNQGFRIIANKGSTRSSKTYSELQLFYLIQCNSKKSRVITIVSHSFPHLIGGAVRDYERILESQNVNVDRIRHINPRTYTIGKTLIEFVGFDNPGKALGAYRDILFINEANKLPFNTCHQLMQRTTEAIFLDWNPSLEFWFDTEDFEKRDDCIVIQSNFFDNIQNLTDGQLRDFKEAKRKAEHEEKIGKKGYWWNWWHVYGLGLQGKLEGIIFSYQEYDELPDIDLYTLFVIDWGGNDPTFLGEINIDKKLNNLYIKEHIYQPQILNYKLIEKIEELNPNGREVICDSSRKDKIFELQYAGIFAVGATKGEGSIIDGIEKMQEFTIFIHKDSENAKKEFDTYKWAEDKITGKSLNIPEDKNNHVIDAVRYGVRYYRRFVNPLH